MIKVYSRNLKTRKASSKTGSRARPRDYWACTRLLTLKKMARSYCMRPGSSQPSTSRTSWRKKDLWSLAWSGSKWSTRWSSLWTGDSRDCTRSGSLGHGKGIPPWTLLCFGSPSWTSTRCRTSTSENSEKSQGTYIHVYIHLFINSLFVS